MKLPNDKQIEAIFNVPDNNADNAQVEEELRIEGAKKIIAHLRKHQNNVTRSSRKGKNEYAVRVTISKEVKRTVRADTEASAIVKVKRAVAAKHDVGYKNFDEYPEVHKY